LNNPIEIVLRARKRIASLAIARTLLHVVLPLIVTLSVAAGFNFLNELAFQHFGYLIDGVAARLFRILLIALGSAELTAAALLGWRTWSYASDLIRTAEQIDRCVDGRQEIVTLASLSDPDRPEAANLRSPLFPVLWERVIASLENFDPRSAFKLKLREPLLRSFIMAAGVIVILSSVAFGLMTRPTAVQLLAHRLQLLTDTIAASGAATDHQQLEAAARDVARDLANPKLPPQEKIAELRALEQELEKLRTRDQTAQTASGNSSGHGNSQGEGSGSGSGKGSGSGQGAGSGNPQTGSGAGKGGRANQQMVELHNDIAKAQMKLEEEANSGNKTTTAQSDSSKGSGAIPKPGTNPNHPGGQNSANGSGPVSRPQSVARTQMPSEESRARGRNDKGTMGDTHLGEFPKPGNYQRFYKLGEQGPPINVRDARYVTFQLPTEIESSAAGALVSDNTRPHATTPYTNAPLKPERLSALPDEQQLVPPRYRELIR
jgi:hypothetical protein